MTTVRHISLLARELLDDHDPDRTGEDATRPCALARWADDLLSTPPLVTEGPLVGVLESTADARSAVLIAGTPHTLAEARAHAVAVLRACDRAARSDALAELVRETEARGGYDH